MYNQSSEVEPESTGHWDKGNIFTIDQHPNNQYWLISLGQNGCHFEDVIFRCIFVDEKFCILIKISLKFVPNGLIGNNLALV